MSCYIHSKYQNTIKLFTVLPPPNFLYYVHDRHYLVVNNDKGNRK